MKFGPVPCAEAVGAILAHSVPLPDGRLRKGKVLTSDDLGPLEAAGIETLTVARLEPGDVHEDAAATRLAQALVPDPVPGGLRLTQAATGRVNVLADTPGLAALAVDRIDAVNRIHPMITVATVPEWQRLAPRGMLATIKIISYAVPEPALAAACAAAQGAIGLQRPALRHAALIQTGSGDAPDAKGEAAIAQRLTRLGVALTQSVTVPHDEVAIAGLCADRRPICC